MQVRSGMLDLIDRFRGMVDDAGTVVFTDDRAQEILDANRVDFYNVPLVVTPQQAVGSVVYTVYTGPYNSLEGTASGTSAFRLFDSAGSVITSGYTADMQRGVITFTANQAGSARYIDGRSYDMNGAAADGWRERASKLASGYDFRVEGRQFNRSQWFEHCTQLVTFYSRQARLKQATVERGDMC